MRYISDSQRYREFSSLLERRCREYADDVWGAFLSRMSGHCHRGSIPAVSPGEEEFYIKRVIHNLLTDCRRAAMNCRRDFVEDMDQVLFDAVSGRACEASVESQWYEKELDELCLEWLEALPPLEYCVMALTGGGVTQTEAGRLMDVPQYEVNRICKRMKASLQAYIWNANQFHPTAA